MTKSYLLPTSAQAPENGMLNKVPGITIYFWIIKILSTTVGETASDFLNVNLGLGLTGTSIVTGALLLVVLFFQLRANKYIPGLYWLAVALISVFGTLITDNLTDSMGVALEASTIVFSVTLALTFAFWYAKEKTLSINSIITRRRELYYWLAVLVTFALGTAGGDLMAERLGLGYLVSGIIVCAAIAAVTVGWRFGLDSVLSFWIAYILTRPLGASLGDYLSQSQTNGGVGLGAQVTTALFTSAILLAVIFLTITKRDLIASPSKQVLATTRRHAVIGQVAVVVTLLIFAASAGYAWRYKQLQNEARASASATSPLGDLSGFRHIAEDTLNLVHAGNLTAAKTRVSYLEAAWDNAEARLKPMNPEKWSSVDDSIDETLRHLRVVRQDVSECKASLQSLIGMFTALDKKN